MVEKVSIGTPRDEIIEVLGKPVKRDGKYIDFYSVCIPKKGDAKVNVAMAIATFGLSELVATPLEAASRCEKTEEVVIVYDNKNKASAIFKKEYYLKLKTLLDTLLKKAEQFNSDNNLALLLFDDKTGWFFADTDSIKCNFNDKYIKVYIKRVITLKDCVEYKLSLKSKTTPIYINQTVLFDIKNNVYQSNSVYLYDEKGAVINIFPNTNWSELYPGSYIRNICDSLTWYCLHKEFKKYKRKKGPSIRDYLIDQGDQREI